MAIIDGKEILTVKHEGKIFALECGCIWSRYYHRIEYAHTINSSALPFEGINKCIKCDYNPWIILPKS